ncbi:hypothetical protein HBI30_138530 [Parastagonospora nodorum]|nr:hypothetical protein HBI30_138530 [Parastagonospora nodorum]
MLRNKSNEDSICDAITLISDKYKTLYAEVKREIRERAILYYYLRIITHLQRKMRYNYNSKTKLQNNNKYAKAIVYSARQSNTINNAS